MKLSSVIALALVGLVAVHSSGYAQSAEAPPIPKPYCKLFPDYVRCK